MVRHTQIIVDRCVVCPNDTLHGLSLLASGVSASVVTRRCTSTTQLLLSGGPRRPAPHMHDASSRTHFIVHRDIGSHWPDRWSRVLHGRRNFPVYRSVCGGSNSVPVSPSRLPASSRRRCPSLLRPFHSDPKTTFILSELCSRPCQSYNLHCSDGSRQSADVINRSFIFDCTSRHQS